MKVKILLGAALCFAAAARAQTTCPQPTLALCQDPSYLQSACGQPETQVGSTCSQLVQAEYQAQTANLPAQNRRVPGNTTAVAPASLQPQTQFNYNVSGGTGIFGGLMQKTQIGGAMNALPPGAAPAPGSPQYTYLGTVSVKTNWGTDGARVKSCDEYVYEGWYDYELFENQAALLGTDYRAIFNLAYGPAPSGIASRILRDRASEAIPNQMTWPAATYPELQPPNLLPKNAFFTGYEKLIAKGFALNDVPLDTALRGGFESWTAQDWIWHAGMSGSLAGTPDDVLYFLEDKKKAFTDLVAKRNALWDKVQAQPPVPPGCFLCFREGELDMILADIELRDMLHDAQVQGCINSTATTACDWSPKMFYDTLQGFFDHHREVARARCMDATGNDFTTARTNATSVGCIQNDMTVKPAYMSWYITKALAAQATLAYPIDPVTGKPHLGDSLADTWTMGDPDWFQIQAGYDASWKIDNFVNSIFPPVSRQTCDAHIVSTAGANATATVLGTTTPVFSARGDAYTSEGGANFKLVVNVLGVEQLNFQKLNLTTKYTYTKDWPYSGSWEDSASITILGIGVTVSGGISVDAGLKTTVTLSGGPGCATTVGSTSVTLAEVNGHVEPWADVDGYLALEVDLLVVDLGIKGTLKLVKLNVPLDANLKLSMTPSRAVFVQLIATGKLNLRTLDGTLSAYADWPWPLGDSEVELTSWDGFEVNETLFNINRSSVNMATVKSQLDPVIIIR
jgi:hypothetical protein